MTAVSDMPNITSEKMTVCSGPFSLEDAFRPKNWPSKRLNNAFYDLTLLNPGVVLVRPGMCPRGMS
jgi:hypothetical protein